MARGAPEARRGDGYRQHHKTGCRRRQGPQGDSYLWDKELHGFGLKVTPAGSKVYLVQYRLGGRKGRTRRVTIGRHGEITPTFARAEAKRLLGEIAAGRDPAAERDKAKADKSLAVVLEQFMAEHVRPKLKASTAESYQRIAMLYVRAFPWTPLNWRSDARGHCPLASRDARQALSGQQNAGHALQVFRLGREARA